MESRSPAQVFALVIGLTLVVAGIVEDNLLHLLIGIAGVGAGLATPATTARATAPRPAEA